MKKVVKLYILYLIMIVSILADQVLFNLILALLKIMLPKIYIDAEISAS